MLQNTPAQFAQTEIAPAEALSVKVCEKCKSRFSGDARFCPFDAEPLRAAPPEDAEKRDPLLGTTVDGRYEIEAIVGEGGMGTVYRARHRVLDKKLALKVLRADLSRDADLGVRFLREAKAAASISHPSVVQITDFGNLESGQPYFVMELLLGSSLSALVRRGGPIPAARAVRLLMQMVDGLEAAHRAGVVHRDLKPDNVVICPGPAETEGVKVLDFGLAKVAGQSRLTRAGLVFGTPHYMSPEQATGGTVDERTDIYSLGVVMYEMFTGRVPFEADSYMGVLTKHLYVSPTPPSVLLGGVAELGALEQVTLRCLEKKPEKRYPSMQALGDELRRVAKFSEDGAFTLEPAELREPRALRLADELELPTAAELRLSLARASGPRRLVPSWASAGVLAFVVTAVLVASALLFFRSRRGPPEPPPPAGAAIPARPTLEPPPARARPRAPAVESPRPLAQPAPEIEKKSDGSPRGPLVRAHPSSRPPGTTAQRPPQPGPTPNSSTGKGKMVGGEIVNPWSE